MTNPGRDQPGTRSWLASSAAGRHRLLVACVAMLGLGVRLLDFNDPPLDFHPIRQFQGALIARHFYYLLGGVSTAAERAANTAMLSFHEPPINEIIGAGMMRLMGRESLGVLRGVAVAEYLLAAFVLYVILRRLASPAGQVAGLAVFLLCPFAISASRAFLPDMLMVVLVEFTLLAALRHSQRRTLASMALVALGAAGAMLVKVQAAPLLLPLMAWSVFELRPRLSDMPWAGLLAAISVTPALAWIVATQVPVDTVFVLSLLGSADFYGSWITLIVGIVGPGLLIVMLGVLLSRGSAPGLVQARLLGAGYLLYAVVLDYRVGTHNYYSLILLPLAALCVAVLVSNLEHPARRLLLSLAVANIAALALLMLLQPWAPYSYLGRPSREATVASYADIAVVVGNGSSFLLLGGGLGSGGAVGYNTGSRVLDWPGQADLGLERLSGRTPTRAADRLASAMVGNRVRWMVITNQAELQAQPDLRAALAGCRSTTRGGIIFYDLRSNICERS